MASIAASGGYLLYLRQEGRGIGLYAKLDAYRLQDQGLDTYQANRALGYDEDPRDYKVSFEKIRSELGFTPEMTVAKGIAEVIEGLEQERFGDPYDARHSNLTSNA